MSKFMQLDLSRISVEAEKSLILYSEEEEPEITANNEDQYNDDSKEEYSGGGGRTADVIELNQCPYCYDDHSLEEKEEDKPMESDNIREEDKSEIVVHNGDSKVQGKSEVTIAPPPPNLTPYNMNIITYHKTFIGKIFLAKKSQELKG